MLFLIISLQDGVLGQSYDTLTVVSYNVLNYPGSTSATRNPEFRKVMSGVQPDVLVVQEMTSTAGMAEFLSSVMNAFAPNAFTAVPFNDGPDTDNGLFFRTDKWIFVSAAYITGGTRDIAEYVLRPTNSSEQLRIYSLHLKASSGTTNEQTRLAEATLLRNHLNALPAGTPFIVTGDFNIYSSSEPAWQKLTGSESNNIGQSFDPLNLTGTWNSPGLALHHTQSPRIRQFGGGSTGGMDDRFDIILTSSSLTDNILTSTYKAYGNDGNHYNDSINHLPNSAVPDSIANALHYAADHIPVTAKFVFQRSQLPVQLVYLNASLNFRRDSVRISWRTASETNNFGFEVQSRRAGLQDFVTIPNSFVAGNGTTITPHDYSFSMAIPESGVWLYRLMQIDLDGTFHYSDPVQLDITTVVASVTLPSEFSLSQNFPNPFNPSTTITFTIGTVYDLVEGHAPTVLKVIDLLGREVATLVNEVKSDGTYSVQWNAAEHSSGVYLYRLEFRAADGSTRSLTKRMVVIK
ncbi:MAG: hypothetical protein HY961_17835 [Ignavibacteriae bacterium]|nr:hypothetical protein [Ignavibacteriota bacterium]